MKIVCEFCGREFSKYGIKNHISLIHLKNRPLPDICQPGVKPYFRSWNRGLRKETDSRVLNNANKVKEYYFDHTGSFSGKKHSNETKDKIRDAINLRYSNGWEVNCGRTKKLKYCSTIAGNISVDGTWELKTAEYLDSIGVKWNRNKKRFPYFNEIENRTATYCPDFFVEDWQSFIEVKGYETELDRCKWKQFNENLIIFNKEKLKELSILK